MNIINKDITTVDSGYIAHVCNNKGAMGAGVAKALYTKWPIIKERYINLLSYSLGTIQFVRVTKSIFVINMIAQDGYGYGSNHLRINSFKNCLNEVINTAINDGTYPNVYLPYKIGCGLAGGNWEEVSAIINEYTLKYPNIFVCKI